MVDRRVGFVPGQPVGFAGIDSDRFTGFQFEGERPLIDEAPLFVGMGMHRDPSVGLEPNVLDAQAIAGRELGEKHARFDLDRRFGVPSNDVHGWPMDRGGKNPIDPKNTNQPVLDIFQISGLRTNIATFKGNSTHHSNHKPQSGNLNTGIELPLRMTIPALVDQDIQPFEMFESHADDFFDITLGVDSTEDALIDALEGHRVLFATSRLPLTERVLRAATDLELIAKIGTGVDSIDLDAASDYDIPVVHTPGYNALSVAEYAVTLLLSLKRKVYGSHESLQEGRWRDEIPLGDPLAGQTVGIVGFGNVGSRTAGLLSGFNVDVLAYDPYIYEIDTEITGATLVDDLHEVLRRADAVTLSAELTDETRGMIGLDEFRVMKDSAVIVNVARGPVVDEEALITAIEAEMIEAAGLDVFQTEPLPTSSPLHAYDNVITTPHIAGTAAGTRDRIVRMLVDSARSYFEDGSLDDRFVANA